MRSCKIRQVPVVGYAVQLLTTLTSYVGRCNMPLIPIFVVDILLYNGSPHGILCRELRYDIIPIEVIIQIAVTSNT